MDEEDEELLKELLNHIDKIGSISMYWIRENVKYSYDIETRWKQEYDDLSYGLVSLEEEALKKVGPAEIELATIEELAEKAINYVKKEFPDEDIRRIPARFPLYWKNRKFDTYELPTEMQSKLERVKLYAQNQLEKEYEAKEREQLEKEKEELPSMVSSCVDWSRNQGIKRITLDVIEVFLQEKNIEIKWQTRRSLHSMANVEIKKADQLARDQLEKEIELKEREQLEKEKEELPSLVSSCVDWAKNYGLKKISKADVEAFILERNIKVLKQTRRSLYLMANVEMKNK